MCYRMAFSKYSPATHAQYMRLLNILEPSIVKSMLPAGVPLKRLGRGYFSTAYQGPTEDSVIRFNTMAKADGDYLRPCADEYFSGKAAAYRPKVLQNCDDVNDALYEKACDLGLPGNVAQVACIEKLTPLVNRSLKYHVQKLFHMLIANSSYPGISLRPVEYNAAYVKAQLARPEFKDFDAYVDSVALFCADYQLSVENVSDVLVRPSTGQLVFVDPFLAR